MLRQKRKPDDNLAGDAMDLYAAPAHTDAHMMIAAKRERLQPRLPESPLGKRSAGVAALWDDDTVLGLAASHAACASTACTGGVSVSAGASISKHAGLSTSCAAAAATAAGPPGCAMDDPAELVYPRPKLRCVNSISPTVVSDAMDAAVLPSSALQWVEIERVHQSCRANFDENEVLNMVAALSSGMPVPPVSLFSVDGHLFAFRDASAFEAYRRLGRRLVYAKIIGSTARSMRIVLGSSWPPPGLFDIDMY